MIPIKFPDVNDGPFKLFNRDVEHMVKTYPKVRQGVIDFLLAGDAFDRGIGPFGFELQPITVVRDAIQNIIEASSSSQEDSMLDPFRRELIFATADATQRDQVSLVLHLYTALMERHKALTAQARARGVELEPGKPSAAGQDLLRCLAVQAAYVNIQTYRFVLEQFARVVATFNLVRQLGKEESLLSYLVGAAYTEFDDDKLKNIEPAQISG